MQVYVNTLPRGQGFYVTTAPSSTGIVQTSTVMKGSINEGRLKKFVRLNRAYNSTFQHVLKLEAVNAYTF